MKEGCDAIRAVAGKVNEQKGRLLSLFKQTVQAREGKEQAAAEKAAATEEAEKKNKEAKNKANGKGNGHDESRARTYRLLMHLEKITKAKAMSGRE